MFNLGDRVKSDYHTGEKNIVRTITGIEVDPICSSGFAASAKSKDGVNGQDIIRVDADWFRLVAENKRTKNIELIKKQKEYTELLIRELTHMMGLTPAGTKWQYQEEALNLINEIKSLEEK